VEVDHFLADLLARARSFGQDTPRLAASVAQLSIYQAGSAACAVPDRGDRHAAGGAGGSNSAGWRISQFAIGQ
jgi:hypothetical protein